MNLSTAEILTIPVVRTAGLDPNRGPVFSGVSTDTRSVHKGDLFVALRGEKFDGHNFISKAVDGGALAVLVDRRWTEANAQMFVSLHIPRIVVENTADALGQIARIVRKKSSIPFIAVGGSNGKTTTREMVKAVLGQKFNLLCTEGNLNNHIGVPLTLFRLEDAHEVAVVEVGTNHPGEIAALCAILEPTHGLITNIGREHLEFFGSLSGVEAAEGEMFEWLGAHRGMAFVNADDKGLSALGRKVAKRLTFGFSARSADIRGSIAKMDADGCARLRIRAKGRQSFDVALAVPGEHNAMNALAAAAVGNAFRIPAAKIQVALESFVATQKRMQVMTAGGVTILNDTYNANPESALAALATLRRMECRGRKVVVLGDMLELGPGAEEMHREVGHAVGLNGAEALLTFGPLSRATHEAAVVGMKAHYEQKNVLAEYLLEWLSPGDVVLVKGSRGMRMEDVVVFLQERLPLKTQA